MGRGKLNFKIFLNSFFSLLSKQNTMIAKEKAKEGRKEDRKKEWRNVRSGGKEGRQEGRKKKKER